jgi:hypothetical protein
VVLDPADATGDQPGSKDDLFERAKQEPLVKKALEAFPGSSIVDVEE